MDPSAPSKPMNWTELITNTYTMVQNLDSMKSPELFQDMKFFPDLPGYTSNITDDKWSSFMETLNTMDTMDVSK